MTSYTTPSSAKGIVLSNPEIFRQIYTDGPLGIAISLSNGHFLSANAAFCKMMGYTEKELASMTFRDITHPEHINNDTANIAKLATNEIQVYRTEKRYISKTQKVFWASLTLSTLRDAKGHILYYLIMVEDISERKQAQMALEENELRFRRILEQAPISMAIVSMNGTIEYINKKAIETFGYLPEDIPDMDRWWVQAYPDDKYRKEVIANWTGLIEEAIAEHHEIKGGEYRVTCKDGSVKTVFIFGIPVANKIFVMFDDITKRKLAELAMKESEEMFRNLAEQSPNMIFIYKHFKNRVVYANHHCEVLTGYSRKEIYSPEFNYIDIIAPEFHDRMRKAFKRHMAGQASPMREYDLITKRGKRVSIVLTTRLIHFAGEPAILGVMTDVTEMKKAQKDVVESAAKLREQKQALQEKNTALKEILAQIETEKLQMRRQISINAEQLLLPTLRKMAASDRAMDRRYIDLLCSNIKDLASKFGAELLKSPARLSPKEMELCNMIKEGMASKDIAELLHISIRTVDTHRNRIRKKLGISSRDINLSTHLQNLA